ncbi:MAG: hypothetical protein O9322_06040 [Beijerinckiaceae bacterium]|nr:hypothetical protein [Beijerinckiaceae bacterium]MCZ8299082.1 hypothetical protein [Beijerinckiaceae bacterium]
MTEGGDNENHWPGYVDALTTMTMMLVFVMMILAIALFGITQNASRSLVEKIADAAGLPVEGRQADTEAMARQIAEALEYQRRNPPVAKLPEDRAVPLEGQDRVVHAGEAQKAFVPRGDVAARQSEAVLTLTFPQRGTSIDGNAGSEVRAFLEGHRGKATHYQIMALAGLELGNASDARRVAFYRALSARTQLIANGIPAQNIQVRVVDSREGAAADRIEIRAMAGQSGSDGR